METAVIITTIRLPLLCLLTLATSAAAQDSSPPSRPDGLRFEVYSNTAAELFWTRSVDSDGLVLGYEVRRDGELFRTVGGPSFFTDELEPGVAREFSVTAVDDDGLRSPPSASVTVDTARPSGGAGDRPAPPTNLRTASYSVSAGEVFWDRVSGQRLTYEVSLDGEVVATTGGTSYFTGSIGAIDGTRVEVVAIGPDGARSDPAGTTFGEDMSPDPDPDPDPDTGAPPVPANLRTAIYSVSAGEVFWDRVTGQRLTYEVSLNGEVAATTDGTSYFTDSIGTIDGTRVEVVAIGPDGVRSAGASATFGEDTPTDPDPDPDPGTDAPPAPANAFITVYSPTAAELFWDRAPAAANVVRTEIVRDGETVGTTNGTSFFDDARERGVDYRYELIAIDSRGERSAPTVVGADDGPPEGLDLLDVGPDLLRSLGAYQLDQLAAVVDDLAFVAGQTTTIVWPDDSWYQVQNAETLDEVCNGGPECQIVPGSYVVINHTIGERSPLEVPYVDPADQADAVPLPASSIEIRGQTIPLERTLYACENEGSVTLEVGSATFELDDFRVRGTVEPRVYGFDQCRITVRDGLLPDGTYLLQGDLLTVNTSPFDGFSYADSYRYDDLVISGDDGLEYRVDGEVERYFNEGRISTARRTATIESYEKTLPDGRLGESVNGTQFFREAVSAMGGPNLYRETLDADGTVSGLPSAGQRVVITTEPVLTRQLVLPRDVTEDNAPVPFNGTVELLAEDGSFLYINANPILRNPEGSYSPPLVDYEYTTFFGQQIRRNQFELEGFPYPVRAPSCVDAEGEILLGVVLVRGEAGRLECNADEAVLIVP